jgi:Protein of unknown function (DUF3107)
MAADPLRHLVRLETTRVRSRRSHRPPDRRVTSASVENVSVECPAGGRVEVKIGVLHTPREIVLETTLTPEEVESTVSAALKSVDGALSLTDERGRKVIVPANLVAYVEIAQADARRVGFVAG